EVGRCHGCHDIMQKMATDLCIRPVRWLGPTTHGSMKKSLKLFAMLGAILATTAATAADPAPASALATEEFMIPSVDSGHELYSRNKRPKDMKKSPGEKIALFVHGSTYPAETSFDLQLDGISWMDYIAQRGYDVYLVDVRGYGRSTRPPEMSQPPENNPPIV